MRGAAVPYAPHATRRSRAQKVERKRREWAPWPRAPPVSVRERSGVASGACASPPLKGAAPKGACNAGEAPRRRAVGPAPVDPRGWKGARGGRVAHERSGLSLPSRGREGRPHRE